MMTLYNIFTMVCFVFFVPFLPFLLLFSKKRRATLGARLGLSTRLLSFEDKNTESVEKGEKKLWIHALSVGEVKSALPLVTAIRKINKPCEIVFTASTKSGYEMAAALFLNKDRALVDHLTYFPLDLNFSINRICRRINPKAVVIVETDLWPNFLYQMNKKNIPVVLVNARLSKRSLNGYLFFKRFSTLFFSFLTQIMVQTPLDKKRYLKLGMDSSKVKVTGNMKFDQPYDPLDPAGLDYLKTQLGIQKKDQVFLAGSTHGGEEKILMNVFTILSNTFDHLVMIIAPRDPKRCRRLCSEFQKGGICAVLMSQIGSEMPGARVIFVDKMGELAKMYAVCDIAFIGGSLVSEGGHNPLEAAVFAKPVLFGPDMSDFQQISDLLVQGGGALQVDSQKDLVLRLNALLNDHDHQKKIGDKSFKVFSAHSGAVKKILSRMEQLSIV